MMNSLETPYEEEASNEYIDCTVCNKSIRGDALYKIHLTTAGHIKKEDVLVAKGAAVRNMLPDFRDIMHFLQYLNIDEPIIGLSYLEEVSRRDPMDPQPGPSYFCTLCDFDANLPIMVTHIIGRKHRKKYLELKRPDLVTWDETLNQSGKLIRAKAEVEERQNGQGTPKPLKNRNLGKLNISKVPPKHKPGDYQGEFSGRGGQPLHDSYPPPLFQDGPYPGEDPGRRAYLRDEPQRRDYLDMDIPRQPFVDDDYSRRGGYDEGFAQERDRRSFQERDDSPRSGYRSEIPYGSPYREESYPSEAPRRRSYPGDSDPLKQLYSEEIQRGRVRADAGEPRRVVYPADDDHDTAPGPAYAGEGSPVRRPYSSGSPEARRGGRAYPGEAPVRQCFDYSHGHASHDERPGAAGARPRGPPPAQRPPLEGARTISEIPEPFKRFLEGAPSNEGPAKKKKSRFSNATKEEMEMAQGLLRLGNEFQPPKQQMHGPRPVRGSQRPESYPSSQGSYEAQGFQRESFTPSDENISNSGNVLDVLNNIEIENAEEANFLKSKLCTLLKEFQAKKSEKAMDPPQGRYKRDFRETPAEGRFEHQPRQPQGPYAPEPRRGGGWKMPEEEQQQQQQQLDDRFQEFGHPGPAEPRGSSRRRYEGVFGKADQYLPPHGRRQEEALQAERFHEPLHPRDLPPPEPLDPYSSAPPFHWEQRARMHQGPQHSSSLDKITSTLLELVARK